MKVEVWGDVVCPWCYIGRKRFEKALSRFDHRDSVEVVYRSFELDPAAPLDSELSVEQRLVAKYGLSIEEARAANARVTKIAREEGLEFHLERARPTNTLAAHRLLQLATVRRVRPAAEERFQRAYFTEGASLADPGTLLRLSTEVGLRGGCPSCARGTGVHPPGPHRREGSGRPRSVGGSVLLLRPSSDGLGRRGDRLLSSGPRDGPARGSNVARSRRAAARAVRRAPRPVPDRCAPRDRPPTRPEGVSSSGAAFPAAYD